MAFAGVFGIDSLYELLPSSQFKMYVCGTLPESVRAIRVAGDEAFLYQEKLIYFEFSPADLPRILREYAYQRTTENRSALDALARQHLCMSLDDLGRVDIYHANLIENEQDDGLTSLDVFLVVNKQRTRAIFFHLYYN